MSLHDLADAMLEIRRYVRTHPEYVVEQINKPVTSHQCASECSDEFRRRLLEIRTNISIGLHFLPCDPEVLEGYLYNAAFEIRSEARRQEKEQEKS